MKLLRMQFLALALGLALNVPARAADVTPAEARTIVKWIGLKSYRHFLVGLEKFVTQH